LFLSSSMQRWVFLPLYWTRRTCFVHDSYAGSC
jgi:hypothetical protein